MERMGAALDREQADIYDERQADHVGLLGVAARNWSAMTMAQTATRRRDGACQTRCPSRKTRGQPGRDAHLVDVAGLLRHETTKGKDGPGKPGRQSVHSKSKAGKTCT